MTTKVFEQMLKDQQILAKQLEVTKQTVATLTINQMRPQHETPPSPTSSEESLDNIFHNEQETSKAMGRQYKQSTHKYKKDQDDRGRPKVMLPKMSFPQFTRKNPTIWKDKCQDYFKIFDIPESMWATYAAMNMDENAAK
jgi:hypothetical protein